jgi:hypothetical protein
MRLSTSRLDERDFDSLPPALRRKVSDSRTNVPVRSLQSFNVLRPACAGTIHVEMESAARISTGSFKSSQPKSGYLRARNPIAQRLPLSYPQSLSELGGLSPGREWSGALGSVPEAAQAHHYATAHTKLSHLQICVFYPSIWGHDTLIHLLPF